MSLFLEKLFALHRFCFYAKILSLSSLLCFDGTSSGLTTIDFFFLSNKTMNLFKMSMYLAKVFHFQNFFYYRWLLYWKTPKNFDEVICRKSLERRLTHLIGNSSLSLIPSFFWLHLQLIDFQDRSQRLHYILFNLLERRRRIIMMKQTPWRSQCPDNMIK